jgi:hypothetical protein
VGTGVGLRSVKDSLPTSPTCTAPKSSRRATSHETLTGFPRSSSRAWVASCRVPSLESTSTAARGGPPVTSSVMGGRNEASSSTVCPEGIFTGPVSARLKMSSLASTCWNPVGSPDSSRPPVSVSSAFPTLRTRTGSVAVSPMATAPKS